MSDNREFEVYQAESDEDLSLCAREVAVLEQFLAAARSAAFQLANYARVPEPGLDPDAPRQWRWRRNRYRLLQSVAAAALELREAVAAVEGTWFPLGFVVDSAGEYSRFTNYRADGSVLGGSVCYDGSDDWEGTR